MKFRSIALVATLAAVAAWPSLVSAEAASQERQTTTPAFRLPSTTRLLVPLAGIEPALLAELDFESSASTSSATGAFGHKPRGPVAKPAEYSGCGLAVNPRVIRQNTAL